MNHDYDDELDDARDEFDFDDVDPNPIFRALGAGTLGCFFSVLAPFAFINARGDTTADNWLGIALTAVAIFFHVLCLTYLVPLTDEELDQ